MSFAADMRDAGRLVHFWSRKEWREIPLEFVLVPSLDGPMLVHDDPPLFTDRDGRVCSAMAMLDEQRRAYPRVPVDKRPQFVAMLRTLWCQIVDQADYYAWPDTPHALYDFAPDA